MLSHAITYGDLSLTLEPARYLEVVRFLRDDAAHRFVCFIDLTAVDYPEREKRFDVVTHLLSPKYIPASASRSRPMSAPRYPR